MSDENKTATTIEIDAPATPETAKVIAPTRDDLKAKGWSPKELESAEKRGMISKKEEKKPEEKKAEEAEVAANPGGTDQVPEKVEPKKEAPKRNTLPDFTFQTPEQEKAFLDAFGAGTPQRAMYFRMKNERHARQAAEARTRELEAQLQALQAGKVERKVEVDAEGNEIDPDDKPLTAKALKEIQQREAEQQAKQEQERLERARIVTEAQRSQEEYARTALPDFDNVVELAKDVMQNLDALVPEKWRQGRVLDLIQKLQIAAANADKLGIDEYNAAFIAHEIGQFHPEYGKAANGHGAETHTDGKSERPESKVNGGLTPEQMKRMEANTQRRASSASIPAGGGKRTVSVDDVTVVDLNKMSFSERSRFREKHPEKYAKLLRG